jgi:hypothetical protein
MLRGTTLSNKTVCAETLPLGSFASLFCLTSFYSRKFCIDFYWIFSGPENFFYKHLCRLMQVSFQLGLPLLFR